MLTIADMLMNPGPTGLDRGTPLPERDQPGHVWPSGGMDHGGHGGIASAQGARTCRAAEPLSR